MITRRQWAGRARVLQVLNLIGPEGPIAPGRKPREEPQGGQEVSGPQAPQHHRPHSTTGHIDTVHSVLTASLLSHHPSHCPSPINFHIKHSKHKRKTMRN